MDISPEDMPVVQEERSNFRDTMKSLWTKIQQQYGYRSNYDLLKAAKDEIDMELGEYQPHIRKSIRKDLEQKRRQADEQQSRRNRQRIFQKSSQNVHSGCISGKVRDKKAGGCFAIIIMIIAQRKQSSVRLFSLPNDKFGSQ